MRKWWAPRSTGRRVGRTIVPVTANEPPDVVLAAYGLAGAPSTPLDGGQAWAVRAEPPVVVKRRRLPASSAGAEWEAELRRLAAAAGWPAGGIVRTVDGAAAVTGTAGSATWTCETWLPGKRREVRSVAGWRIVGRLLGRLHSDLSRSDPGTQRPGLGKAWELDVLTEAAGAGTFNRLVAAFGHAYPEVAAAVRRERYRNLRELARLGYPDLPEQPIHGSFSPGHLLWTGGELTGVIGWEFARRDAAMCDLAPLLMPDGPLELPFAQALFEGYAAVRPVSNQEFGLLPALVRAWLLWQVTVLLIGWRLAGGDPAGVVHTMEERFPAFERYALELGMLRANVTG